MKKDDVVVAWYISISGDQITDVVNDNDIIVWRTCILIDFNQK